jgi:hypothetical protein
MRFSGFAALGMALAIPALAAAHPQPTQTMLSAQTRDLNGRTQVTLSISVSGDDGAPVSGPVVIQDEGKPLAGVALDDQGTAHVVLSMLPGEHSLRAVYAGDTAHAASTSEISGVRAQTSTTPDFQISVNPASLSLTAGQSGTVVASITPVNASALTAPMFVTLSCSGAPDQSSCSFTPENIEILSTTTDAIISDMVITTQSAGTRGSAISPSRPGDRPVSWAVLLPGALGLLSLVFSARRRRWLTRLSLLALVGWVTVLGATACAPRYNYFNHGPPQNLPTPAGTYTLNVTAQSSNGVTATTHFTTLALTVK